MKDVMVSLGDGWWCFPGTQIDTDWWEGECRSDGKMLLRDDTGVVIEGIEVGNPEGAGVLAIPPPEKRRRREIMLAGLLAIALEILRNERHSESVKIETAKDIIREFKHVYPETTDV